MAAYRCSEFHAMCLRVRAATKWRPWELEIHAGYMHAVIIVGQIYCRRWFELKPHKFDEQHGNLIEYRLANDLP